MGDNNCTSVENEFVTLNSSYENENLGREAPQIFIFTTSFQNFVHIFIICTIIPCLKCNSKFEENIQLKLRLSDNIYENTKVEKQGPNLKVNKN